MAVEVVRAALLGAARVMQLGARRGAPGELPGGGDVDQLVEDQADQVPGRCGEAGVGGIRAAGDRIGHSVGLGVAAQGQAAASSAATIFGLG